MYIGVKRCVGFANGLLERTVDEGDVFLTDQDFNFVSQRPMATDEIDLESKSNYKF
jgi:hypothetical protein